MPNQLFIGNNKELRSQEVPRPHVVLLGAGASRAAFPNGDANGTALPVLKDFVNLLGIGPLLLENGIEPPHEDFEAIYSKIASNPANHEFCQEVEGRIWEYFARLQLPSVPTLYDFLICGLRPKDYIATFNWDPLLYHAAERWRRFIEIPNILYLHGNTAIGTCLDCKRKGWRDDPCEGCGQPFLRSPLLYPVADKTYTEDLYINAEWNDICSAIKESYIFTIFGYSGPKTDKAAVNLLKQAWDTESIKEFEIIDISDRDHLRMHWNPFIEKRDYQLNSAFFESIIGRHPRRSCESRYTMSIEAFPFVPERFPECNTLHSLREFIQTFLDDEELN